MFGKWNNFLPTFCFLNDIPRDTNLHENPQSSHDIIAGEQESQERG